MLRIMLSGAFVLGLIGGPASVLAEDKAECVPDCRSGYLCHKGQCISQCNPPCESGTLCTNAGECAPAPTAQSTPTMPTAKRDAHGARFAVMGGLVMGGEIYADPPDIYLDTESGMILRATADSLITQKLSVGGYLNYVSSEVSYGSISSDLSIVSIGLTMKLTFEISPQTEFRAGIGLGYQMSEAEDIGEYGEDIVGFDLAPITELAIEGESGLTYLISLAGFSQPSGGNDEADVSWSPILFLSGGIQFGG